MGLLRLAAGAAMATAGCQPRADRGTPQAGWEADDQQVTPADAEAPPPRTDTVLELERLARLHESGALSYEEFTAAKARVLGVRE
jgi:hypothetical protein